MNNTDIELKLLSGDPIPATPICNVLPLTLNDIKNMGIDKYNEGLSLLCVDPLDIKERLGIEGEFSTLDFLKVNARENIEFADYLVTTLRNFIDIPIEYNRDYNLLYMNNGQQHELIEYDTYERIKNAIKIQHCLNGVSEYQDNPANEKARQLLEKKRRLKKKLNKSNQNSDDEPLTLFDLISILAGSTSNYNLINRPENPFNVWNLTMFQFENAFNRLKMFNEFTVNIQALLQGAKPEDIGFKHFISKIPKN